VDLDNAYYRIWVASTSQIFLEFERLGRIYAHCGIPFGWRVSPAIFLRVGHQLLRFMLFTGLLCSWYMDDGFFIGATEEDLLLTLRAAKRMLNRAGHCAKEAKSSQCAETALAYLGLVFNILTWQVSRLQSVELLNKVIGLLAYMQTVIRGIAPLKNCLFDSVTWQRRNTSGRLTPTLYQSLSVSQS
jgi:hypothetical protein